MLVSFPCFKGQKTQGISQVKMMNVVRHEISFVCPFSPPTQHLIFLSGGFAHNFEASTTEETLDIRR